MMRKIVVYTYQTIFFPRDRYRYWNKIIGIQFLVQFYQNINMRASIARGPMLSVSEREIYLSKNKKRWGSKAELEKSGFQNTTNKQINKYKIQRTKIQKQN